jgi:hypothetical protein
MPVKVKLSLIIANETKPLDKKGKEGYSTTDLLVGRKCRFVEIP